jgi:hypothetical protein
MLTDLGGCIEDEHARGVDFCAIVQSTRVSRPNPRGFSKGVLRLSLTRMSIHSIAFSA